MATSRTYEDSCGVAHGLELVGERWALLVLRELMLGAKRFGDLKADLPGISANVLTHRLVELERAGLVTRRKLPKPAAVWVYELTDWARELEPVMQLLGRWAARDPNHRKDLHFGVTSLILSLRTNFDAALADGANLTIDLRANDESYIARVARRKLTITPGRGRRSRRDDQRRTAHVRRGRLRRAPARRRDRDRRPAGVRRPGRGRAVPVALHPAPDRRRAMTCEHP